MVAAYGVGVRVFSLQVVWFVKTTVMISPLWCREPHLQLRLKYQKKHRGPLSTPLQVQAVWMRSYYGAQGIKNGSQSTRDSTNKLVNLREIKVNASIKIVIGYWENSTIDVAKTVLSKCEEINSNLAMPMLGFARRVSQEGIHVRINC